jgi:endonuclease YncB( thermonuclease family)
VFVAVAIAGYFATGLLQNSLDSKIQEDVPAPQEEFGARKFGVEFGRVVGIADGDTLTILAAGNTQVKVRLYGIDSPERGQAYNKKAKAHLSDLIYSDTVTVSSTQKRPDRWGRVIAIVESGGVNINLRMVEDGFAWWYQKYAPKEQALADAEGRARAAQRGIWADPHILPPWEYRARGGTSGREFEDQREGWDGMDVVMLMFITGHLSRPAVPPAAVAPMPLAPPPTVAGSEVYVTETGSKYHRASCGSLSDSKIPMSLADARAAYGPCATCEPPR